MSSYSKNVNENETLSTFRPSSLYLFFPRSVQSKNHHHHHRQQQQHIIGLIFIADLSADLTMLLAIHTQQYCHTI
ncbi:hypothetical protein DERF_000986 [Dermatophagoides farinae]|uniref:Uncharacterized protein n=1 Tax=Dermatophagoides farinae TaxID=6954 RepID=A0A922L891_DERFA|nr:hypothetical protein DERF_000986 [Dermatophagoides farinae]